MRVTELRDVTLGLKRQGDGFMLTIEDKRHGETLWLMIPQAVADEMVAKLTGGIIPASKLPFER